MVPGCWNLVCKRLLSADRLPPVLEAGAAAADRSTSSRPFRRRRPSDSSMPLWLWFFARLFGRFFAWVSADFPKPIPSNHCRFSPRRCSRTAGLAVSMNPDSEDVLDTPTCLDARRMNFSWIMCFLSLKNTTIPNQGCPCPLLLETHLCHDPYFPAPPPNKKKMCLLIVAPTIIHRERASRLSRVVDSLFRTGPLTPE